MHRLPLRTLLVVVALGLALGAGLPAFAASQGAEPGGPHIAAQEGEGGSAASGGDRDVKTVVLWTIASIAAGAAVMGALYTFKRRVGGFPRNPTWVAPITILRSADAPDEGTFPDDGSAGDAGHGHAPAH
jgi:hypothetical protein